MTRPGADRPPVLSEPLAEELRKYLRFRHVFRHSYSVRLRWAEMAELAIGCPETLARLKTELAAFLQADGGRQ